MTGKRQQVAEQYLKKGARVYLEGSLQTRKWQDRRARTNTPPRWCCRAITRSSPCLTGRRAVKTALATAASCPVRRRGRRSRRWPARANVATSTTRYRFEYGGRGWGLEKRANES